MKRSSTLPEVTYDSRATLNRRSFVRTTAAAGAAVATGLLSSGNFAYAAGSDSIRIGLVGCGGRGKGAVRDAVKSSEGVSVVALGDLFEDQLQAARPALAEVIGDAYQVPEERMYLGFDAYRHVIEDPRVNYVILATPCVFRPVHLRHAIRNRKHTFAEKPIGVDPPGCRSVLETAEIARRNGVGIVAGTQRRHTDSYVEAIRRIHDGEIGEVTSAQVYFNVMGRWPQREPGQTDLEYYIRNWFFFNHIGGDISQDLLIHNIDVANWVMQDHPVKAIASGGRSTNQNPEQGNIFDNFTIDFEYPNGTHVLAMTRWQDRTATRVMEQVQGTLGHARLGDKAIVKGKSNWQSSPNQLPGIVQEHGDFIASIRAGEPLNEGKRIAESNLTSIMGREAAYTGRELTWDDIGTSRQDLTLDDWTLRDLPLPPIAVPGVTALERNWLGEPLPG